ncbi:MAG TPA: trehalase family glycosidase [Dinghuibacter sp.]|uniref:MGH1-like glycoside hydrolase domain-containing protein n=1 Tax=Dinghuibacter sp. TaxID=2024697 RepID=UPI002BB21536|nr:trehalase family glycosidase [Dinghuibacter sp.]HTJ11849.1 trehalase family glycosidase [Dinghuibacter sp.]
MTIKRLLCHATLMVLLATGGVCAQPVQRQIRTPEYRALQERLSRGWNTWYNNSLLSWVLLPQGFSINLCLDSYEDGDYLREVFKSSPTQHRPETVVPGLRSDDGSYTSLHVRFRDAEYTVESATDGDDELILVTPAKPAKQMLIVEAGLQYGRPGEVGESAGKLVYRSAQATLEVGSPEPQASNAYVVSPAPHICLRLDKPVALYTGRHRSMDEVRSFLDTRRRAEERRGQAFGDLADCFRAMQTILTWNTVYDAANERVITPVSRLWNRGWGGFVLFDWDTYFAGYMCSYFNKDLAYANMVEITKAISAQGFIPNYQAPFGNYSWDRSEPPVGAILVLDMYKRFGDKWFLTEVYDELLAWNRWWAAHRTINGYLAWGSDKVPDSLRTIDQDNIQAARFESGLDNSPMYDSIPFNKTAHTMELADVGLMSLYVADCHAMEAIAHALGHEADARELAERAAAYGKTLAGLWDDRTGLFLNRRTDNGQASHRLSPTLFYPLLAKVATQAQAGRMIREHYFNTSEFYGEFVMPSIARNDPAFHDNDYWRGRIWGPMNFLVYLGLRNYDLPDARADLVRKSRALLMKSWTKDGSIFENYNSVTGQGDDVNSADAFYHWGALLSFLSILDSSGKQ